MYDCKSNLRRDISLEYLLLAINPRFGSLQLHNSKMKVALFALCSLLFLQGALAKINCYQCAYNDECKGEGTSSSCTADSVNCFYSINAKEEKEKSCYGDREGTDKPELNGLKTMNPRANVKINGCVDIKSQKDNEDVYKACICEGKDCNTNNKVKEDMKTSNGQEGKRSCYSCGKLGDMTACTKEELEKNKPTECGNKEVNCFVYELDPPADRDDDEEGKTTKIIRGCMPNDSDKPYMYGSFAYDFTDKSKGNYYICNKNECNKDKQSWEDSSVAGLSASLSVLLVGLLAFRLF